jgi:hypothetical protein
MKTFSLFHVRRWYHCPSLLLVFDGEGHSFSNYFTRFVYNARIWTVMARSRWDLGYSRLLLVEDL